MHSKGLIVLLTLRMLCFIVPYLLISCSQNEQEINKLYNTKVTFPIDKMEKLSSKMHLEYKNGKPKFYFYAYYDSEDCLSCILKKFGIWNSIIKKSNQITNIEFVFIISPQKEDISDMKYIYFFNQYLFDLHIDINRDFEKANPFVKKPIYHHFLTDSQGNLIFIGNPSHSESAEIKLYEILKKAQ